MANGANELPLNTLAPTVKMRNVPIIPSHPHRGDSEASGASVADATFMRSTFVVPRADVVIATVHLRSRTARLVRTCYQQWRRSDWRVDGSLKLQTSVRIEANRELRRFARRWAESRWAIEVAGGLGAPLATRLLADGLAVLDVPAKLAVRERVISTGPWAEDP